MNKLLSALAIGVASVLTVTSSAFAAVNIHQVSVANSGQLTDDVAISAAISNNGRYVAFFTGASNMGLNAKPNIYNLYLYDRQTQHVKLVSVGYDGSPANNDSIASVPPKVSADGRYVFFNSNASNLVPNDNNNFDDIFVRDMVNNTTEMVSVADDESLPNSSTNRFGISSDGRYVAFASYATNLLTGNESGTPNNFDNEVYLRDRVNGTTELISVRYPGAPNSTARDNFIFDTMVSDDGKFVGFSTSRNNIVPNDTDNYADAFLRDRVVNTTEKINIPYNGSPLNEFSRMDDISSDGRYVLFESYSTNLVPNDTNDKSDVFLRDRTNGTNERVSVSSSSAQGNNHSSGASMSSDARFIVFNSTATNFFANDTNDAQDIFIRDRQSNQTDRVSVGYNGQNLISSVFPVMSDNGQVVAFEDKDNGATPYSNTGEPRSIFREDDVFVIDRGNSTAIPSHVIITGDTTASSGQTKTFQFGYYPYGNNGFTLKTGSPSCGTNGTVVTNSLSVTPNGGSFQCSFTGGSSSNVSVQVTDSENVDSNVAELNVGIDQNDLAITMTDSPDPITPRNELTYTLTVTNTGQNGATNVVVNDTLPTVPQFVSASSSQGSCVRTTNVACTLGSLASGASATVTIVVKPTDVGTFSNTATVSAFGNETNPADNTATEGTTVASAQDLSKLRVSIQGNGTVTSNPSGINCHPNCVNYFYPGTQVTLTATPLTGYEFIGWDFDCSANGTNPTCTLTATSNGNLSARAKFTRK